MSVILPSLSVEWQIAHVAISGTPGLVAGGSVLIGDGGADAAGVGGTGLPVGIKQGGVGGMEMNAGGAESVRGAIAVDATTVIARTDSDVAGASVRGTLLVDGEFMWATSLRCWRLSMAFLRFSSMRCAIWLGN